MGGNLWRGFFHPVSGYFRRKRLSTLLKAEPGFLSTKILDVGGSLHFWQETGVDVSLHDITLLNVALDGASADLTGKNDASKILLYDGVTIPFPDRHFDFVLCNSVIEHVDAKQRERFSSEIRRVAKSYIVQTPAFAFPIEPHFVVPFLHWLPRRAGRVAARIGLWSILGKKTHAETGSYFDEVRLLTLKEFQGLFPGARVVIERFAFIPKSYVLILRDPQA